MAAGLFILLNDIKYGFYGFLMSNLYWRTIQKETDIMLHYQIMLAVKKARKFFLWRTITYGGVIKNKNNVSPVFNLNWDTSPIERKTN